MLRVLRVGLQVLSVVVGEDDLEKKRKVTKVVGYLRVVVGCPRP